MERFDNHTFVVCAYKESEFLEECVKSLLNQTVKSNILIATSTPNEHIKNIAEKYNIDLYINTESKGIGPDWNYAVTQAKTDFVTVAHQDDIYDELYTEKMQNNVKKYDDIVMVFTNHKEIRNGKVVKKNINLKIKALMMLPLKISNKSKVTKKMTLYFGNPICCPSVMLNTKILTKRPYREDMLSNIDWGTWLDFLKYKGRFVYEKTLLTYHRVHPNSETSRLINNKKRIQEDYEMFCRIWPKPIAKFIMFFYKYSVLAN